MNSISKKPFYSNIKEIFDPFILILVNKYSTDLKEALLFPQISIVVFW